MFDVLNLGLGGNSFGLMNKRVMRLVRLLFMP